MNPLRALHTILFQSEFEKIIRAANAFPRFENNTIDFRGMKITMTDYLSVAYQLKEIFGQDRLKFTPENSTPVIYDCGANVGVVCLYMARHFPNALIKAFEPDPHVFKCLEANIFNNGLNGVELHQSAVWINDSGVEFGIEGADGGSIMSDEKKVMVASERLASLLLKEEQVDLLKMDIEGAEVDVLLDCADQLKKVKYLFIEYHSWTKSEQRLDSLLAVLSKSGFRYYINSIGHFDPQPFINVDQRGPMDIQLDIHAVRQ